jgi:hypothetical protein
MLAVSRRSISTNACTSGGGSTGACQPRSIVTTSLCIYLYPCIWPDARTRQPCDGSEPLTLLPNQSGAGSLCYRSLRVCVDL